MNATISKLLLFSKLALEENFQLKNTFSYKHSKDSGNYVLNRNASIIDNEHYELSLEKQTLAFYLSQSLHAFLERIGSDSSFNQIKHRSDEIRKLLDKHFYSENMGLYADLLSAQWLPRRNKEGQLVAPVTWRDDSKCGDGFPSELGFNPADCAHPVTAVPYLSPKAFQEATAEELSDFKAGKEKARLANRARCCQDNRCEVSAVCLPQSKSVSIDESLTARRQNQFSPVVSVVNLWPLLFYSPLPDSQERYFPQFFS